MRLILTGIGVLLLIGSATAGAEPFSSLYFEPTIGRVGYHFDSHWQLRGDDKPAGYRNTKCWPNYESASLRGALPPGVQFENPNSTSMFTGTPRQPGTWRVEVDIYGLHCTVGPHQHRYNRTVPVTFRIEP